MNDDSNIREGLNFDCCGGLPPISGDGGASGGKNIFSVVREVQHGSEREERERCVRSQLT